MYKDTADTLADQHKFNIVFIYSSSMYHVIGILQIFQYLTCLSSPVVLNTKRDTVYDLHRGTGRVRGGRITTSVDTDKIGY
jgi:hypothetical protein